MIVSADVPTLKSEMVDWLVDTCMKTQDDLYYGICPRNVMEKRFPGSNRTYTKLKDIELCGADINISHVRMATEHLEMWESLIGSRKNPFKQAGIIGLGTLWKVFTKSLTLDELAATVSERIGIKGRAIVWSQAEPCMDVDKPHQLELLTEDLIKQQKKAKTAQNKKVAAKTTQKETTLSAKAKSSKTSKTSVKSKPKAKPKKK
jgi:hypothetical protein